MEKKINWWSNEGGFFGKGYIEGDNSLEGFIPNRKERLYERTKREVDGVIFLTKLKTGVILDLPCGYGRHSTELANRGFEVVGMDINEEHLTISKKNAKNKNVSFLNKDMRNIGKENYNKFDLVINMFYSFGFFENEKDNENSMKEFYNSLKKGGKLVLHTDVSPELIEHGNYQFNEERNLINNKKLIIQEKYDSKTHRINGSWLIVSKNGQHKLTPYSVRIYTKSEFETLAKKVGFKNIVFYGSFNGDKFNHNSSELIMIAEK